MSDGPSDPQKGAEDSETTIPEKPSKPNGLADRLLCLPHWIFAMYVAIGYGMSAMLHFHIWRSSPGLNNWVNELISPGWALKPYTYLWIGLVLAALTFVATWLTLALTSRARDLVLRGLLLTWTFPIVSQFLASSATRLVYEAVFPMVALFGFAVSRFILKTSTAPALGIRIPNPWRAVAAVSKGSIALLALLAGTVATAVLTTYPTNAATGAEVARQIVLIAYVVLGLTFLVFPPALIRALESSTGFSDVELEG